MNAGTHFLFAVDTAATVHIARTSELRAAMTNYTPTPGVVVYMNSHPVQASGIGTLRVWMRTDDGSAKRVLLEKVLYVPESSHNLISVPGIAASIPGFSSTFASTSCVLNFPATLLSATYSVTAPLMAATVSTQQRPPCPAEPRPRISEDRPKSLGAEGMRAPSMHTITISWFRHTSRRSSRSCIFVSVTLAFLRSRSSCARDTCAALRTCGAPSWQPPPCTVVPAHKPRPRGAPSHVAVVTGLKGPRPHRLRGDGALTSPGPSSVPEEGRPTSPLSCTSPAAAVFPGSTLRSLPLPLRHTWTEPSRARSTRSRTRWRS
jgi:hypothetical protein